MKLETPFIAILMGSLVFMGIFTMFTSMADDYGVTYDLTAYSSQDNSTTLLEAFDKLNETKTEMDETTEEFSDLTLGDSNDVFEFLNLGYKVGKQVFSSLNIFKTMINIMGEIVGIPADIIVTLFSILMVVFVMTVIIILLGRVYS